MPKTGDPIRFLVKTGYARLYIRNSYIHANAVIRGHTNIRVDGSLKVGIRCPGFMLRSDKTFLRVDGNLRIKGDVSIGRGSRLDICRGAICTLDNCNLNGASLFIVETGLSIGEGSTISWGCQFMDSDWHSIDYAGKKERDPRIVIGKRVWIGSNVLVNKGVELGDGCVVASGAVVTRSFPGGMLIGGNPARIIREEVMWS